MNFSKLTKFSLGFLLVIGSAAPVLASTLNCQLDEFNEGPELVVSAAISKVDEQPGKEAEIPTEDIAITFTDFVFSGRLQPNDLFGAGLMQIDGKTTNQKSFTASLSIHGKKTVLAVRYDNSAAVDVLKCVNSAN